jgi:HSP20 family molecular chaperone IbpA
MKPSSNPLTPERRVKIVAVAPTEQTRRIDAAIARRAYEIFEKRGSMGWHELEDWRQAEAEVLSKLCFGLTTQDHMVVIGTDVAGFEPGTLELWVAPRQLTLCGQSHSHSLQTTTAQTHPDKHLVFREIHLPSEIDPANIETSFHGRLLEIKLPQARLHQAAKKANAA